MSRNIVETALGAVVLAVAVIFLVFAYSSSHVSTGGGYEVTAKFDRVEGVREGGDVRISGIKVGTILSEKLDPKTFQAVLRLSIQDSVKLPTDTVATITSAGLLGEKFLQLVPGADDQTIPPGGQIKFTQPPISLESLLGQFVFSMGGGKSGASGQGSPAPSGPPSGASGPTPTEGPAPSRSP